MKNLANETSKLIKGLKLLLLFGFVASFLPFIIQSCQREQYENSDTGIANAKFTTALKQYKNSIGNLSINKRSHSLTGRLSESGDIIAYMELPLDASSETIAFYENMTSIQDLANLIDNHNAILQYEPTETNSNYQVNLPLDAIEE